MIEPQDPRPHDAVEKLLDEAEAVDDLECAMPLYERALTLDPDRAATHYNIGLVYKYRGAWAESLHHNRRASDLRADDEAANWNMGIAATALREWDSAREAWRRVGLQIPDGDGPIQGDFGITPVRLNPDDKGEVVWGTRIDPVRVVLGNIPYPDSGFRAGDIVLHDGAPVGERRSNGRTYSVFNVLELFESSANSTYEAEVRARDAADLEALTAALDAARSTTRSGPPMSGSYAGSAARGRRMSTPVRTTSSPPGRKLMSSGSAQPRPRPRKECLCAGVPVAVGF